MNFLRKFQLILIAATCLSACATTGKERGKESSSPTVHSIGTMRSTIWDGELSAKVSIDELNAEVSHLYAVGPMTMLAGEVTIIDGDVIYSEVTESGPRLFYEQGHGAPFLAYASVPAWADPVMLPFVGDMDALEAAIEQAALNAGLDTKTAFPIRIEATVEDALIHIVDHGTMEPLTPETHDAIKMYYGLEEEAVDIVGFYSIVDRGVFVHHDRRTHLHLVTKDRAIAGHADALSLREGAMLYLPDGTDG